MLGSNVRTGPRAPPKASVDAIDAQLVSGDVQMNATLMSREELLDWAKRLRASAHRVKSLKILCVPRGLQWAQYHYANMQDRKSEIRHVFSLKEHKMGVTVASANVQHHIVRTAFYQAVCAVVRRAPVAELVLGLRFSESGYKMLSDALAANKSLKRLSFAGSHMGNERFMGLKPGLIANNSLEELDLTACALTDEGALCVASVIKAHADRRLALAYDEQLRQYPDSSLPSHAAHRTFHARLRAITAAVDERCGGLLHLELAENRLADRSARALHDALSYDRRLIFLSLRANKLTAEAEAEFIALMKEHQALLRVDLRQNPDPQLGILKLKRPMAPRIFSSALGFKPNPAAAPLVSPAVTDASMPLWALREEAPRSLGPTPMATPRRRQPPASPGRLSTVSWGDAHLLTRGSPRATMEAAAAAAAAEAAAAAARRRRPANAPPGDVGGAGGAAAAVAWLHLRRSGSVGGDGGLGPHWPSRHARRQSLSAPASPSYAEGPSHGAPFGQAIPSPFGDQLGQVDRGHGFEGQGEPPPQHHRGAPQPPQGDPWAQAPAAHGGDASAFASQGPAGGPGPKGHGHGHGLFADLGDRGSAVATEGTSLSRFPTLSAIGLTPEGLPAWPPAPSNNPSNPSNLGPSSAGGLGASREPTLSGQGPRGADGELSPVKSDLGITGTYPDPGGVELRVYDTPFRSRGGGAAEAARCAADDAAAWAAPVGYPAAGQSSPPSPLGPAAPPAGSAPHLPAFAAGTTAVVDTSGPYGPGPGPGAWARGVVAQPQPQPPGGGAGGEALPPEPVTFVAMPTPVARRVVRAVEAAAVTVAVASGALPIGSPMRVGPPVGAPGDGDGGGGAWVWGRPVAALEELLHADRAAALGAAPVAAAPALAPQGPGGPAAATSSRAANTGARALSGPGASWPPRGSTQARPDPAHTALPPLDGGPGAAAGAWPPPQQRAGAGAAPPGPAVAPPWRPGLHAAAPPPPEGWLAGPPHAAAATRVAAPPWPLPLQAGPQGSVPPPGSAAAPGAAAWAGPAGVAVDASDEERQRAFLSKVSLLHRGGLAAGQANYSRLFSLHPGLRTPAEAPDGSAGSDSDPGSVHRRRRRRRPGRLKLRSSRKTRRGTKRRQPGASPHRSRGSPGRSSRSRSRPRSRSQSRSRSRFASPARSPPGRRSRSRAVSPRKSPGRLSPGRRSPARKSPAPARRGAAGSAGRRSGSPGKPRRRSPGRLVKKPAPGCRRGSPGRVQAKRTRASGASGSGRLSSRDQSQQTDTASRRGLRRRRRRRRRRLSPAALAAVPADPLSITSPAALAALEHSLLTIAAEIDALEAVAAAAAAAAQQEAERKAAEEERRAAEARRAAAAEAKRRAAEAVAAAERRLRREAEARAAAAVAAEKAKAEALRRELARREGVRQYEGAARGAGVNVNTIVTQLERWCGLRDEAVLQPPRPPLAQEQESPPPVQQQQQQERRQAPAAQGPVAAVVKRALKGGNPVATAVKRALGGGRKS